MSRALMSWAIVTAFAVSVGCGQGQPARAARFLGATESLVVDGTAAWHFAHEHFVATVRAQLDEATFAAAWAEGQALTLEQAIAEALNR